MFPTVIKSHFRHTGEFIILFFVRMFPILHLLFLSVISERTYLEQCVHRKISSGAQSHSLCKRSHHSPYTRQGRNIVKKSMLVQINAIYSINRSKTFDTVQYVTMLPTQDYITPQHVDSTSQLSMASQYYAVLESTVRCTDCHVRTHYHVNDQLYFTSLTDFSEKVFCLQKK